jgi:hypothetical protein
MLKISKTQPVPRLKYAAFAILLFLVACSGQTNMPSTQPTPTAVSGSISNPPAPVMPSTAVSTQAPGATTAPVAGNATDNVCSYLTQDQVQPVVGTPITGVRANAPTYNVKVLPTGNCTYMTSFGGVALVISQPSDAQGSAQWTQDEATFFTNVSPDSTTTQVPGLGDTAVWMDNGKSAGGFGVAKYPYLIAIVIGGKLPNNPQAYQPELKQLAETVLSELH